MAFGLMWKLVVAGSYCKAVGVLEISVKGEVCHILVMDGAEFIP